MVYFARYGVSWTLHGYQLVDRSTGQYRSSPALATGDFKVEKDGGAAANLATLPVVAPAAGSSISITFSAGEMQCQQLTLRMVDASGAQWNDDCIHVWTVGDSSAMLQSDPFAATMNLSPGAISQISSAVWEELRINHTTANSFGEGVSSVQGDVTGDLDGSVEGDVEGSVLGDVDGSVGSISSGGIVAASFGTGAITSATITQDACQKIADEVLNRNLAGGGSGNSRNVRNALRSLRNRIRINGGTLEIYQEDDATLAWTAVSTTTAGNPITEIDPS